MTTEPKNPQLNKDEALDLATKLQALDSSLSPTQRTFLHFAINRTSLKNRPEVEGFDQGYYHDTGYYDLNTGLEIYAVDWYTNNGYYEGTSYFED